MTLDEELLIKKQQIIDKIDTMHEKTGQSIIQCCNIHNTCIRTYCTWKHELNPDAGKYNRMEIEKQISKLSEGTVTDRILTKEEKNELRKRQTEGIWDGVYPFVLDDAEPEIWFDPKDYMPNNTIRCGRTSRR